jgi:hypothetical protein
MTMHVQIIECAAGWQAEVSIGPMWTAFTKVLPTVRRCEEEVEKLCERFGLTAEYEEEDMA